MDSRSQGPQGQEAIARCMVRIEAGHPGDVKPLPGGIGAFRIHHGPGYRRCLARRGKTVFLLPFGGDKGTQERAIRMAQSLAREIDDEDYEF